MSDKVETKPKVKKPHPLDKMIGKMLEFMHPDSKNKNGDTLEWHAKPEVSELTEIFIGVKDDRVIGHLVHDGKIIKIEVQPSQTWKPIPEVRFGEMFTTSMAVDNKKGLDLYLKGLYDKKVPKSRKKDIEED